MSIVGFKAANHPQQTKRRGADDSIDDRRTPIEVVELASGLVGGAFDLDAAASAESAKAPRYYSIEDDGLVKPWSGRVWCNPPYSDCAAWVRKAWAEFDAGAATAIAMLLPANRTEQRWWQELVEPRRDHFGGPLSVRFLPGRIRFGHPEGWVVPAKGDRPPFGCCLLIWTPPRPGSYWRYSDGTTAFVAPDTSVNWGAES